MSLHRVLGTAGHIDHGKTSLVRALTGIDTDRLKEEKARGITIELGFAHLALPSGAVVGVIDVPGHERFIRTMVAGAVGVDAALLVVAADEGVMQQTREHLDICGLLGIRAGVVALTKCDLVEPELRALAVEELREALRGTFLESAEVVACSAKTGEGLPQLRQAIEAALTQTQVLALGRSPQGLLRLPVDRVFTLRGFGTVATGTLWSGTLRVGDELQPLPGTQVAKVRGLHVHGQAVTEVVAGQRTAVNLALPLSAVARGETLVPPGTLQAGTLLDVRLTLLGIARGPLARRSRLLLHLGTAQTLVLVTLLDRERLEPGESALAQLQLAQPLTALPGGGTAEAIPPGGPGPSTPGTWSRASPRSLQAGGLIHFTVGGFPKGETVYIKIDDGRLCSNTSHGACVYHSQKIPSSGVVNGSFRLPGNLKKGSHTLRFLASAYIDPKNPSKGTKGYTNKSPAFTVTGGSSGSNQNGNNNGGSSTTTTTTTTTGKPKTGKTTSSGKVAKPETGGTAKQPKKTPSAPSADTLAPDKAGTVTAALVDGAGNVSVVMRGTGFGEGTNGVQRTDNDPIGMVAHTGELVSFATARGQPIVTLQPLSVDGAAHYAPSAAIDPELGAIVALSTRSADLPQPFRAKLAAAGVEARPARAAAMEAEPDMVVYSAEQGVDFAVESLTTTATQLTAGATIPVQVRVRNGGGDYQSLPAFAAWQVVLSFDAPYEAGGANLASRGIPSLASGQATTFSIPVTVPAGFSADQAHVLYARIYRTNNPIGDVNNTNDEAHLELGGMPMVFGVTAGSVPGTPFVQLRWEPVSDPLLGGYRVWYHDGDGDWKHLGSSFNPGFLDLSAPVGTERSYRITSYSKNAIESPPSDAAAATATLIVEDAMFGNGFE